MACGYDAEQQLLSLTFVVVAGEKSMTNWDWFIQWLRKKIVGPDNIIIISYQHLGIRAVFERPDFGWQESVSELFTVIVLNTLHKICIRTAI
jgi:hypothetical protein